MFSKIKLSVVVYLVAALASALSFNLLLWFAGSTVSSLPAQYSAKHQTALIIYGILAAVFLICVYAAYSSGRKLRSYKGSQTDIALATWSWAALVGLISYSFLVAVSSNLAASLPAGFSLSHWEVIGFTILFGVALSIFALLGTREYRRTLNQLEPEPEQEVARA